MIIEILGEKETCITETQSIHYVVKRDLSCFVLLDDNTHIEISKNEFERLRLIMVADFEKFLDNAIYIKELGEEGRDIWKEAERRIKEEG